MLPIIMAGIMAAQSFQKGKEGRAQAKLDKKTNQRNVLLENQRRDIDNTLAKARGDLARYQQERSNKYKMIAGAESIESQKTNLLRISDAAVRGSLENRIAASEVAGAISANAGFAGVGGGSIDMLNATNTLRQQRAQELADRQLDDTLYDGERNIKQTLEATVLGLDDVAIFDDINYMRAQESHIKVPGYAEIGMQAGMQFMSSFTSMGGFDGMKLPSWAGGKPTGAQAAGYSPQVLGKWGGVSTQLK
jgi:hypothetical protein